MLEIIDNVKVNEPVVIPMGEMKPLEVGRLISGKVVMRTSNSDVFEVMDLSDPFEDNCWNHKDCSLKVTLLAEGESINVKLFNTSRDKDKDVSDE